MMPIAEVTLNQLLNESLTTTDPLLTSWRLFAWLFLHGGWAPIVLAILYGLWTGWLFYIRHKYNHKRLWVLLAIDVPKDNEQSPKAIESIFAHLAGAHGSLTKSEIYWEGVTQDWFSLELISIEGYVQFLIRTAVRFRDLVEAAVYSQYPDAVITEVEEYTKGYPSIFPDERYQMYGTEFLQVENEAYPIRTYPEFEYPLTKEFKDPMLALLETFHKLGPGEQLWLQIIIVPIEQEWKEKAVRLIRKMIGEKKHRQGGGLVGGVMKEFGRIGQEASGQFAGLASTSGSTHQKTSPEPPNLLLYLPPDQKEKVDGITRKIKKIGFETKIRSIYIAEKERFNVEHGREALVGAIKQFNTNDLNSLKPDTHHIGVHAHYLFTEWRKNWKRIRLMRWYKHRSPEYGAYPYVMNTEELATIWHFPSKTLTVPMRHMVQKTDFKRIAPPSSLPLAGERTVPQRSGAGAAVPKSAKHIEVPDNLPVP